MLHLSRKCLFRLCHLLPCSCAHVSNQPAATTKNPTADTCFACKCKAEELQPRNDTRPSLSLCCCCCCSCVSLSRWFPCNPPVAADAAGAAATMAPFRQSGGCIAQLHHVAWLPAPEPRLCYCMLRRLTRSSSWPQCLCMRSTRGGSRSGVLRVEQSTGRPITWL